MPEGVSVSPAAPIIIFHFLHQATLNQSIQPDPAVQEERLHVVVAGATHRGLLKKRKQQRGVRSLEGALRRTVPDRSNTTISRYSREEFPRKAPHITFSPRKGGSAASVPPEAMPRPQLNTEPWQRRFFSRGECELSPGLYSLILILSGDVELNPGPT